MGFRIALPVGLATVALLGLSTYSQVSRWSASSVHAAEEAPQPDRWVGTYRKYPELYMDLKTGEKIRTVTITKGPDGYRLGDDGHFRFTEIKPGVLQDSVGGKNQGGLGEIYFGTTEFADGRRARTLRAEFCYEQFFLFAWDEEAKDKEKPAPK